MTNFTLTDAARAYLKERRAEAIRIVTSGAEYTESQRRTAWAHLTGMPAHFRAPVTQGGRIVVRDEGGNVA